MSPDIRVGVEVACQITLFLHIAPKIQRHRRDGLRTHQLTHLANHRLALLVPGLHRAAQQAALHLARDQGQLAVAANESTGKIRPARNIAPPDVRCPDLFKLRGPPALHLGGERRASRAQCPHLGQIATLRQIYVRLQAIGKKRRASAKKGHTQLRSKAPQRRPVGCALEASGVHRAAAGMAVKNTAGRAVQQAAHLRIPHHPAGRAVPVVALAERVGVVAAAHVVVQHLECQRHNQRATVAMHNRFRQPSGAAGVDNPQRVVKRQPKWLKRRCLMVILSCSRREICFICY